MPNFIINYIIMSEEQIQELILTREAEVYLETKDYWIAQWAWYKLLMELT